MILRLLLLFILFFSLPVQARMYQWTDPDSGTTQLSGKPPAWYRSEVDGPRTFVFEKGQVIDDTAINISYEQRELLRQSAFLKVEEEREIARLKALALEAEKLKAEKDSQAAETDAAEEEDIQSEELALSDEQGEEGSGDISELTELTAEDMRALITEWEIKRTEAAKELIRK